MTITLKLVILLKYSRDGEPSLGKQRQIGIGRLKSLQSFLKRRALFVNGLRTIKYQEVLPMREGWTEFLMSKEFLEMNISQFM